MKKVYRRLSWLLLFAMLFSMLSVGAWAVDDTAPTDAVGTPASSETATAGSSADTTDENASATGDTSVGKTPTPVETEAAKEGNSAATTQDHKHPGPVEPEKPEKPENPETPGYPTSATIDHIEIELTASVTYTVDGEPYTQYGKDMIQVRDRFTVSATKDGVAYTGFTYNPVSVEGNGSAVDSTVKITGSFPTGTKDSPVIYTVSITKDITLKKYYNITVPITLTVTTNYWDTNNNCPGIRNQGTAMVSKWQEGYYVGNKSGIDVPISGTAAGLSITSGKIMIKKVVSNGSGNFQFTVQDSAGQYLTFSSQNEYTGKSASPSYVTVPANGTVTLTKVPVGIYRITEIQREGYIVTDADGNYAAKNYSVDYTVEDKKDNDIPVATFTNKKLSNETGISLKKVATGLNSYSNPTVTIKNSSGKSVWTGTVPANGDTLYLGTTLKPGIYTVEESGHNEDGFNCQTTLSVNGAAANGLTFTVSAGDSGKIIPLVLTNTYSIKPQTISFKVEKQWVHADGYTGDMPSSVTVQLYNGTEAVSGKTAVLNAANNWAYEFTELDASGSYSVREVNVPDKYDATYTDTATKTVITNTHRSEKVSITVTKSWNDGNDHDGFRPDTVTVALFADGDECDRATFGTNGWSYTFEDLPKYENGEEIVYTVAEINVDSHYISEVTSTENGFNIENSYTPEFVSIKVTKKWVDDNNRDDIRPDSIKLVLTGGGESYTKEVSAPTNDPESNTWVATFTNLPKYVDGQEITYVLSEEKVSDGYKATVNGYTITNTHDIAVVEVAGSKTWDDFDDWDGKRPDEITINLLANGTKIASKTVTANDGWKWDFGKLPEYENGGKKIVYTITEDEVDGYTTTVNGFDVTNTHARSKTDIEVTKIWKDFDDYYETRPETITVELIGEANGEVVVEDAKEMEADEDGNWTCKWTGLFEYNGGYKITYSIKEVNVPGYTTSISGYTITNTLETTSVTVNKVWDDGDNQDGIRPTGITVYVTPKGASKAIASAEITADKDGKWSYTFRDLPKYKNGEVIEYEVSEKSVKGYEISSISKDKETGEITITNTHAPEVTNISIEKIWKDNNNKENKRPGEIKAILYANGEKAATVTLNTENQWKTVLENLPVYEKGTAIKYTVKEEDVKYYVGKVSGDVADGFTITNTFVDIPLTGDTMSLLFWSVMAVVAGAALTGVVVYSRRRKA